MAGPALREVLARFGVDVDSSKLQDFVVKIDGAISKLERFGHAMRGIRELKSAITEPFQALKNLVTGFADAADEIDDTAEFLGMSREALQAWRFAAEQNGLRAGQLAAGMQRLTASADSASQGGKRQAKAFKDLGVEYKDAHGNVKAVGELLPEVSAGLAAMDDPTKRAGVALDLFGRTGLRLLPLLSQGPEGMKAYREEMERLGGGMTDADIRKAGDFNDAVARLEFSFTSLKARALGPLIPVLENVVTWLSRAIGWVSKMGQSFEYASKQMHIFESIAVSLGLRFGPMLAQWALRLLPAVRAGLTGLVPRLRALWTAAAPLLRVAARFVAVTLAVDELIVAFQGGKTAIGDFIDSLFGIGTTQEVLDAFRAIWDDIYNGITLTIAAVKDLWGALSGGDTSNLDKALNSYKGSNMAAAFSGDRSLAESGRERRRDLGAEALRTGDVNEFVKQRRKGETREDALARFKSERKALIASGASGVTLREEDNSLFSKREVRAMSRGRTVSEPVKAGASGATNVIALPPVTINLPPGSDTDQVRRIEQVVKNLNGRQAREIKVALGNGAG